MTIPEAIKKAKEGGYECDCSREYMEDIVNQRAHFLDLSFWQSLGKAMGWSDSTYTEHQSRSMDYDGDHNPLEATFYRKDSWKYYWHRFIDHLAEGKTAEDFFAQLK